VLDGIVAHLTTAEASVSTRKKKKAKIQQTSDSIQPKSWHLRALVLSCLKNCFLHDTGSLKFLDTNNFQVIIIYKLYFCLNLTSLPSSWSIDLDSNYLLSTGAT